MCSIRCERNEQEYSAGSSVVHIAVASRQILVMSRGQRTAQGIAKCIHSRHTRSARTSVLRVAFTRHTHTKNRATRAPVGI